MSTIARLIDIEKDISTGIDVLANTRAVDLAYLHVGTRRRHVLLYCADTGCSFPKLHHSVIFPSHRHRRACCMLPVRAVDGGCTEVCHNKLFGPRYCVLVPQAYKEGMGRHPLYLEPPPPPPSSRPNPVPPPVQGRLRQDVTHPICAGTSMDQGRCLYIPWATLAVPNWVQIYPSP